MKWIPGVNALIVVAIMMVVETAKRELKDMVGALEEKGNGRRITFH